MIIYLKTSEFRLLLSRLNRPATFVTENTAKTGRIYSSTFDKFVAKILRALFISQIFWKYLRLVFLWKSFCNCDFWKPVFLKVNQTLKLFKQIISLAPLQTISLVKVPLKFGFSSRNLAYRFFGLFLKIWLTTFLKFDLLPVLWSISGFR